MMDYTTRTIIQQTCNAYLCQLLPGILGSVRGQPR